MNRVLALLAAAALAVPLAVLRVSAAAIVAACAWVAAFAPAPLVPRWALWLGVVGFAVFLSHTLTRLGGTYRDDRR